MEDDWTSGASGYFARFGPVLYGVDEYGRGEAWDCGSVERAELEYQKRYDDGVGASEDDGYSVPGLL